MIKNKFKRILNKRFYSYPTTIPNSPKKWDAIVIGAGHNGLICSNYLARKGLKVLCLERRKVVGGAAVTEEMVEGFKFSRCSYVSGLLRPQVIEELELKKYGLQFFPRNPSKFTPMRDGRYLMMGPDHDMTKSEIEKFSKKDAENYFKFDEQLNNICLFWEALCDREPVDLYNFLRKETSFSDRLKIVKNIGYVANELKKLGKDILPFYELVTTPANKILEQWFESEPLRATLATDALTGAYLSPSVVGSGYVLLHHSMGVTDGVRGVWAFVKGGMGGISESIAKSGLANGVNIVVDQHVEKILVENGKASGVVLKGGEKIESNLVVSNATASVTFQQLLEKHQLPNDFITRIEKIDYSSPVTKINVALDTLPNFKCFPNKSKESGPQHCGTIHINCEDSKDIEKCYLDSIYNNRPSKSPLIEMVIPSSLDPTISPPGKHVALLFCQYTPYSYDWNEKTKDEYAKLVFSTVDQYIPNFSQSIVGYDMLTPPDLESTFNLTGGNIFHGSLSLDQLYFMRPVPGYTNYTTPIKNLYLCGSSSHPGGGVTGAPSRNASRKILEDLKIN